MKKTVIIVMCVLALVFIGFSLRSYLGFNANSIEIMSIGLDRTKLRVYKGFFSQGDRRPGLKDQLIFDGAKYSTILTEYGENDFLFIYDDNYYYSFRYFKTNNRQCDDFVFKLARVNESFTIAVDIKGTDSKTIKGSFKRM